MNRFSTILSYDVLLRAPAEDKFFARPACLAIRVSETRQLAQVLTDEGIEAPLAGGEIILIGPLERVPQIRRFAISYEGKVREREPQHDRLSTLEQLLLRALYSHCCDAASETPAEAANVFETVDGDDRRVLTQLLEEEQADRS